MSAARELPPGFVLTYYGDDFTGSSAVMEVTAFAGLDTVLFLAPPSPERLAAFASYRVIGIAGTARSQSPTWMRSNLPGVFQTLRTLGAPIAHYKVCSTFDSSPEIGSIGCAADIAADVFQPDWMPMIVGEPGMARFQAFGHLFAAIGDTGYRLDRHPVMSRHPVTPMHESDLNRHLSAQTGQRIGLVDFVAIKRGEADRRLARELAAGARIVSIDVLDQETLVEAGRLVWERGGARTFAVGSQGLEAALVAYWRSAGLLSERAIPPATGGAERIVVVSGSVSPITAAQIACSREAGIALDTARVVDERAWQSEIERAVAAAAAALAQGRDAIVYSAAGPDDPAVAALREALGRTGTDEQRANEAIGTGLGQVLSAVMQTTGVRRAVISGGDTSGRAAAVLGVDALTALAPIAPGSPLCRAHCASSPFDGIEIALKGGQVGAPDFFLAAKRG